MSDADRDRLLQLLEKYGRNLHSFMVLEPGLRLWFEKDAAVAYVQQGGYWVAVGSPICSIEDTPRVVTAFREAAAGSGHKVVFFAVTENFIGRIRDLPFDPLQVGMVPTWDPSQWDEVVRSSEKLRNRIRKGSRVGLKVRAVPSAELCPESPIRAQMVQIVDAWANGKALPPMGFMVTIELFQHAERRRYFVVELQDQIQAFAVCVPIYGRNGWLLEDMMVLPSAPSGASELLIDTVMRQLSQEGADIVSLGMVALAGLDSGVEKEKHPFLTWLLRSSARTMGWLYHFEGLYRFRNKLKPSSWERVYIVASERVSFLTIRSILMAFAQGWVPRFGLRVAGRWIDRSKLAFHSPATPLRRKKPWIDLPIAALAVSSLLMCSLAVIGNYVGWLPWWLSLWLGSLGSFVGFTPIHEAVHGNVSRWPLLNRFVGHLGSMLLLGAFGPYVYLHREHHLHTNHSIEDPDVWCADRRRWLLPLRWLTQDLGYLLYYFSRWTSRPWGERLDLLLSAMFYSSVAILSWWLEPNLFYAFLFGWFLPARISLFALAMTFSWLPHHPHSSTAPYEATTVRSTKWLKWLLIGQNFHLVHHLHPGIPFYRLEETWHQHREEWISQGAVDASLSVRGPQHEAPP